MATQARDSQARWQDVASSSADTARDGIGEGDLGRVSTYYVAQGNLELTIYPRLTPINYVAQISFELMAVFLPSSLVLGLPLGASTSWSGLSLQVMLADEEIWDRAGLSPWAALLMKTMGRHCQGPTLGGGKRGGVLGKHSSVNTLSVR